VLVNPESENRSDIQNLGLLSVGVLDHWLGAGLWPIFEDHLSFKRFDRQGGLSKRSKDSMIYILSKLTI
jgi:hypothetical protein